MSDQTIAKTMLFELIEDLPHPKCTRSQSDGAFDKSYDKHIEAGVTTADAISKTVIAHERQARALRSILTREPS